MPSTWQRAVGEKERGGDRRCQSSKRCYYLDYSPHLVVSASLPRFFVYESTGAAAGVCVLLLYLYASTCVVLFMVGDDGWLSATSVRFWKKIL